MRYDPMTEMVTVSIPMSALVDAVRAAGLRDRLHEMVEEHGEVCSRARACKILHCGDAKLTEYIQYGKIRTACEGVFIDVRSIAEFMERKSTRKKAL